MVKGVFIANAESRYNDRRGEVYHFPNIYLSRVVQTINDWVLFYQSRRGGRAGYYAVQRVARVELDPSDPTHSYALLDRASELDLERAVPRVDADGKMFETGLPNTGGSNASAVRLISDADFAAIISEGLRQETYPDALPRTGPLPEGVTTFGFAEAQADFITPGAIRPHVLTSRTFRDAAFARQVKRAYSGRCAMSRLALRNGGGRPEVEAAHIIPVEAQGPDTVRNGLALSGTIHWMFDRGLVSADTDGSLLIAKNSIAAEIADRLFVPDRRLIFPVDPAQRPHAAYMDWHRRERFKG